MIRYLLIFLLCFASCKQQPNKPKDNTALPPEDAIDTVDDAVEAAAGAVEIIEKTVAPTANEISERSNLIKQLLVQMPVIENFPYSDSIAITNYNPTKALTDTEIRALQLHQAIPFYYKNGALNKVSIKNIIDLSDSFYAILISYMIDNGKKVNTGLFVYTTKENTLIDSRTIASSHKNYEDYIEAKFDNRFKFKTNYHSYKYEPRQLLWEYVINYKTGKIEPQKSKLSPLVSSVLENKIQVNRLNIDEERIITKTFYDDPKKIIVVIPEIVEEEEYYSEYNSHMLLVDVESKTITASFSETPKENGWVSDAVRLSDISIQNTFYGITDNTHAFALSTQFVGMSRVNPYESKVISLYVKSGDTFKKILNNFEIYNYGGEFDGECEGVFIIELKTLRVSSEKTNGYYDILVKNIITEDKNIIDENGECQSLETHSTLEEHLVYNGVKYVKL